MIISRKPPKGNWWALCLSWLQKDPEKPVVRIYNPESVPSIEEVVLFIGYFESEEEAERYRREVGDEAIIKEHRHKLRLVSSRRRA